MPILPKAIKKRKNNKIYNIKKERKTVPFFIILNLFIAVVFSLFLVLWDI